MNLYHPDLILHLQG